MYDLWLKQCGLLENPRFELDRLCQFVLKISAAALRADPERLVSKVEEETLERLLNRRLQGEPMAYLLGEQGFWDIVLKVNEHTLIPRPETEQLVQYLLEKWDQHSIKKVLDLGTGSGAIALALAKSRPQWDVWGVDRSAAALAVAQENADLLKLNNVCFLRSDWFSGLEGERFDAIVSNPPYLGQLEMPFVQAELHFEPIKALVSGKTGLEALERVIQEAGAYLHSGGWLVLEHGFKQHKNVLDTLKTHGWQQIQAFYDLNNCPRMCVGRFIDNP